MKIKSPFLISLTGFLAAQIVRTWTGTLEYKSAYYDPTVDPVDLNYQGPKIFVFWHEYISIPLGVRGHCDMAMLLSRHTDAEILSRVAYHLGFDVVRGSTRRGGASAIRKMLRKSRDSNLVITPDGPRGPRRRLAQGPIYLASKLGLPLVFMGLGYDRPWRVPTWDRFAIPRPYSRARGVLSPQIQVPSDLDRAGIEHYRRRCEALLNRLTLEAEAWAESGTRKLEEVPIRQEPSRRRLRRIDPSQTSPAPHRASPSARLVASILSELAHRRR